MKKLSALLLLSALFFSCKKDKDPGCATDVSHISGSYKFTAYTYKQTPTSPEEDYFNILFPNACERDDILTLNATGNWTKTDAGSVCSPSGSDSGAWSLSGTSINVDGDISTIESFDCKTLILVNNDVMVNGDKLKITLTKQ
jgi:hypothetical protein